MNADIYLPDSLDGVGNQVESKRAAQKKRGKGRREAAAA